MFRKIMHTFCKFYYGSLHNSISLPRACLYYVVMVYPYWVTFYVRVFNMYPVYFKVLVQTRGTLWYVILYYLHNCRITFPPNNLLQEVLRKRCEYSGVIKKKNSHMFEVHRVNAMKQRKNCAFVVV